MSVFFKKNEKQEKKKNENVIKRALKSLLFITQTIINK